MRKLIVFLIGFVSLFLGTNQVSALTSRLNLSNNPVSPNSTVTVRITVGELPSSGLGAADYVITYDTSKLTYVNASSSWSPGQGKPRGDFGVNEASSGTIRISYYDSEGGSNTIKNGDMITLTFTVKAGATGSSTFGLSGGPYRDGNAASISGTTTGVTLNYSAPLSSNANLTALSVSSGSLSPAFDSNTATYNVTVDSNVSSITINATGAAGTRVSGAGTKSLNYGLNTFNIEVTAENGTTKKTYAVRVTRADNRSTNNNLKALKPSAGTINFNAATLNYNVTIPATTGTFTLQAEAADAKATIAYTPSNSVTIKMGETKTIGVVVTAENGAKKTYNVNVRREDNRSGDNNLKALTVSNTNIKFNASTTTYTATVGHDVTNVNITATANDTKAKITGIGTKQLAVGKNTFDVIVTAENEKTKTYSVTVIREDAQGNSVELSKNNYLKSLKINGEKIDISKEETKYRIDLLNDEKEFTIEYELEDANASAIIANNEVGSKKIEIIVTAEDGTTRTYILLVGDEEAVIENAKSSNNTLLYISLAGNVILGIILASVVLGSKKENSPQQL